MKHGLAWKISPGEMTRQVSEDVAFDRTQACGIRFGRLAAVVLITTAVLKCINFLNVPLSPPRPDSVLGFVTNREFLILAAIFELSIARKLLESHEVVRSAIIVLYFCLCATIYQIALFLQGDSPCACLGIASEWLGGPKVTTLVARAILAALWIGGLFFIIAARGRSAGKNVVSDSTSHLILLLLLFLLLGTANCLAATVQVHGEYTDVVLRKTRTGARAEEVLKRDFVALFDHEALKITYSQGSSGPRSTVGPCMNSIFVTKEKFVFTFQCRGSESANVVFDRVEYPWELGICGVGVENCVFLTIRCLDFFGFKGGSRLIAPPWTTIGEPLGLINEAQYTFSEAADGYAVAGRIKVSGSLREKWLASELLSPGFNQAVDRRREDANLSLYRPGFLTGEFRFSDFTNVSELKFPMLAEFWRYDPPTTGAGAQPREGHRILSETMTLLIQKIEQLNDKISILPVSDQRVFVQDKRLFSHRYHITEAKFQTNSVTAFEISPLATTQFESGMKKARERERVQRLQHIFSVLLIVALALGGIGIYCASRWWDARTQRLSRVKKEKHENEG